MEKTFTKFVSMEGIIHSLAFGFCSPFFPREVGTLEILQNKDRKHSNLNKKLLVFFFFVILTCGMCCDCD